VERWLGVPGSVWSTPRRSSIPISLASFAVSGTGGNLTTDAFLAVLAPTLDVTLCSADHDFRRFQGLRLYNPLSDRS
jgi:hypothetical protein